MTQPEHKNFDADLDQPEPIDHLARIETWLASADRTFEAMVKMQDIVNDRCTELYSSAAHQWLMHFSMVVQLEGQRLYDTIRHLHVQAEQVTMHCKTQRARDERLLGIRRQVLEKLHLLMNWEGLLALELNKPKYK